MPELPEVEAVCRQLEPALLGARIARVLLRRSGLRRPFPTRFAERLRGCRVEDLTRRGKYILATLSSGDTLLMHLGMSGMFRVERQGTRALPHDHVVLRLSSKTDIVYNDPRRFGTMELVNASRLDAHPTFSALGPEPLSDTFDAAALARTCAGRRTALKVALLDQRVVAGLGNIYASEALHVAGMSPRRRASTMATATGRPRGDAARLVEAIKAVLMRAIARSAATQYRGARFRVYEREGDVCPTRQCGGTIRRIVQSGRSTFYCPTCQRR